MDSGKVDVAVIGAGPNGLAAAITLARAGRRVVVHEMRESVGGGARTAELTLPGFLHDVCSTSFPLGVGSPFFRRLPLAEYGLGWVHAEYPLAHPFDDGTAAVLSRSIPETVATLDTGDSEAYEDIVRPYYARWDDLLIDLLAPLHVPRHPVLMGRFGLMAIRSTSGFARSRYRGARARALFAGMCAHAMLPLDMTGSAAAGLVLGMTAHAHGWPFARGGASAIPGALTSYLGSLGGKIEVGRRIVSLDELPSARAYLFDTSPGEMTRIAGGALPESYHRRLRGYRYGPGACKIDWALSEPIPWRAPECRRAGVVHLGGTLEEIAGSERAAWERRLRPRPFVILAQPTVADPSRAPAGKHVAWAYCHVPHGSPHDTSEEIELQIERFAPGFRDVILGRAIRTAQDIEHYNPNWIGGDINGGAMTLDQLFARPAARPSPYSTPDPRIWLCSSSTPPGGGVHGMCGFHAARAVLRGPLA